MGTVSRLWSGIRRKCSFILPGTATSASGLFFAFVIASILSWSLLLFSWWLLALRARLVRGYTKTTLWWVEAASVGTAALGHFVLLYFAAHWQLPLPRSVSCLSPRRHRFTSKAMGDLSGEDTRVAVEFGEEAETRTRDGGARAVTVGGVGGLQQRSSLRLPPVSSAEAKSSVSQAALLTGETSGLPAAVFRDMPVSFRKLQARVVRVFPFAVAFICASLCMVHVVTHARIPERHRQSQEIVLGLIRVCSDVVLLMMYEIFIALRLEKVAGQSSRGAGSARVSYVQIALCSCSIFFAVGILYILIRFFWLVFAVDTIEHLKYGVTASFDFCAKEGLRMDPAMAKSWVWPALMHRRTFNFWTGSEKCSRARRLPPISFLDAEDRVLLVSPQCADGSRPRVYLHRPENNEFNGNPSAQLPETARGNLEYHRQLEVLFGTDALATLRGVVVRRRSAFSAIQSVEVDPKNLTAQPRRPRSSQEEAARKLWPDGGQNVFSVPLGLTAAYTVLCEALDHEEYHLFPIDDAFLDAYSVGEAGVRGPGCFPEWKRAGRSAPPPPLPAGDEPAGNVLILLLDAVSRQEMRRSLPKFSNAIVDFAASKSTEHHVLEAEGAMTLGTNTAANMVPLFAGTSANVLGLSSEAMFTDVSLMNTTVFVRAKEKYEDTLSTAFTSAFCHDIFEYLMGHTVPSSGAGGRVMGIDRYMYQPFCHLDYSGVHSNFKGPYSIVRRCMAGEAVWDHMVNYTEATLEKQLEGARRALNASTPSPTRFGDCHARLPGEGYGKHFFHVMYMTEGHEGTHGVIPLVDDSLTRFFHDLRFKLKFFENPLNTFLLLADHGNHMGHYFEYTNAGKFERGTPPVVMLIHPEVLNRIDRNKGRGSNIAVQNLLQRTKRVSTPLDMYLTLADLLNVKVDVYHKYRAAGIVRPASLFDLRDAGSSTPARNCSQFSSDVEHYACPLDFCRAA